MFFKLNIIFAIILTIILEDGNCLSLEELTLSLANIPEDGRLQFCPLAKKYGYDCISYNVTTEDGYILNLFNIPGDRNKPILLQHGFLDSADTFLIRTNRSLVAFLQKNDYDIWLGNMRGNKYSRAHESLNPDELPFWEFSFHEIGCYDMPAMIDFVLKTTGQSRIQAIGHSLGTTALFVMGAMKPEYNDKIKALICLAPVAYLHNAIPPIFPLVSTIGPVVNPVSSLLGHGELLRNSSELVALYRVVATQKIDAFNLRLFGLNFDLIEPDIFPTAVGHYPSGSSNKNLVHLAQIVLRKQFAQYDHGWLKNYEVYKNADPPAYDLSKVTIKITLVVGLTDKLADVKDVELLRPKLSNIIDYYVVERKDWNHFDFVWSKDMNVYLFGYVLETLNKYWK